MTVLSERSGATSLRCASVDDIVVDAGWKGFPLGAAPRRVREIGATGWRLLAGDLPFPACVLKASALERNAAWMRQFLALTGARLAPHGKTTTAPQLFHRQLADGAWGLTAATPAQLGTYRQHGIARILFANQLVDPIGIAYVIDELRDPDFQFLSLVDSVAGVDRLADAAHGLDRPLELLLEGGLAGGRTGCRSVADGLEVARAVAAAPGLSLRGVEGFEGIAPDAAAAEAFLGLLAKIAEACDAENLFAPGPAILSAGGSSYYDLVVERFGAARLSRPVEIVLRSGCYLTHDSGLYERAFEALQSRSSTARDIGGGFAPALEVWAMVQSRPEPTRAVATMGKRDVSSDVDLPVPAKVHRGTGVVSAPEGLRVAGLNDQHALLDVPADADLAVGDLVGFGVSHPCTTFDRWRLIYVVDDAYAVRDAVVTFF